MDYYIILVYISTYIGLFAASFYVINLLFYYNQKHRILSDKKLTASLVVPAYNEEKTIAHTIKSLLALNYPKDKFEIIIVDDGSQDRTYSIAKKFESNIHPKIKVFTKNNGGKGSALNLGISKSKNEIIISMDADSFITPEALLKIMPYFYSKDVMAVTPSMTVHNPKSILQRIQQIEYNMGVFLRKSFATVNAIHITPGAFSAYRKEFFMKYGGYDEYNMTEDLEIALRIQSKGFIIENSPEAVVYTVAPRKFKELLIQRRRWYSGLAKNLYHYRSLFGPKKGPLGLIVLPVAVTTILLSMIIFVYSLIKTLVYIRSELLILKSINFRFINSFEIDKFVINRAAYTLFTNPAILLSLLMITILISYLYFASRKMKYKQNIKLNLILFILFYGMLYSFWWFVSLFYVLFGKKVTWRSGVKDVGKI